MNEEYFTYYFKVENSKVVKYKRINYPALMLKSESKDYDYFFTKLHFPSKSLWAKKIEVLVTPYETGIQFKPITNDQVPDYLKAYLLLIQQ